MTSRTAPALAIALVLATGVVACGADKQAARPVDCGDIGFTAQSDDGAFNIAATGVPCRDARTIAAMTRNRRYSDPLSFEADGFSCTGTRITGDTLPGVNWRCTRAGDTVTFTRN